MGLQLKFIFSIFFFSLNVLAMAQDMTSVSSQELVQRWIANKNNEKYSCANEMLRRGKDADLVSGLVGACDTSDMMQRTNAVALLNDLGADESAPALQKYLDSSPEGTKCEIVGALGNFGDISATPKILSTLDGAKNPVLKVASLSALGEIGDSSALPRIKEEFEKAQGFSRADYVRASAAFAMAQLGDFSGHEEVVNILKKGARPEVEMQCLRTLAEIGDSHDTPLIDQVAVSKSAKKDHLVHDFVAVVRCSISSKGLNDEDRVAAISKILNPSNIFAFEWGVHELGKKKSEVFLNKLKSLYADDKYSEAKPLILKELNKSKALNN